MQTKVEREVLGGRQGAPRRDQSLGGRIVGVVHERHDALAGTRTPKRIFVAERDVTRKSERGEHNGERLDPRRSRLADNLHREQVVR